jgi:nitrate/TMAO reductase-like tetraheme cytochrome c subunit
VKRTLIAFIALPLVFGGGAAFAKATFVQGAKCTACHEGKPTEKKLNAKAQEMLKQHTTEQCKDCHGPAEGDKPMTTTKK